MIRDDGVRYHNIKTASIENNIADSALISAIRRGGSAGGHTWMYVDERKQSEIEGIIVSREKRKLRHRTNLSIMCICIDTNEIRSVSDFARQFRCGTEVIYNAIDFHQGYSKYLNKLFKLV